MSPNIGTSFLLVGIFLIFTTLIYNIQTPDPVPVVVETNPVPVVTDPDPTPDPTTTPDSTPEMCNHCFYVYPTPIPDPTPEPDPIPDPTPVPDPTPEPTPVKKGELLFSWDNPAGISQALLHTLIPDTTSEFISTGLYVHNDIKWGMPHEHDNRVGSNYNLTYEYTSVASVPWSESDIHSEDCSRYADSWETVAWCDVVLKDRSYWGVTLEAFTEGNDTIVRPRSIRQKGLPSLNYATGWYDSWCTSNYESLIVTHNSPTVTNKNAVHPTTGLEARLGSCSLSYQADVEANYIDPLMDAIVNIMPTDIKNFIDWFNVDISTSCELRDLQKDPLSVEFLREEEFGTYTMCAGPIAYFVWEPHQWISTNSVTSNGAAEWYLSGDDRYYEQTAINVGGHLDTRHWDGHTDTPNMNGLTTAVMHEVAHAIDSAVAQNRLPTYSNSCGDSLGWGGGDYNSARRARLTGFSNNNNMNPLNPLEVAAEVLRNYAMNESWGIPFETGRFIQQTGTSYYAVGEDIYDQPYAKDWAAWVLNEGLSCVQSRLNTFGD